MNLEIYQKNHLKNTDQYDGKLYSKYGFEFQYVIRTNNVWHNKVHTLINENNEIKIVPVFRVVNVVGYLILK